MYSSVNQVERYSVINNIIKSGILYGINDNTLKNTVFFIMVGADVNVQSNETEVCHKIGKSGTIISCKISMAHFVNQNY